MKDLGDLHYFLGIQVVKTSSGMLLSQHKYVLESGSSSPVSLATKSVCTSIQSRVNFSLTEREILAILQSILV